MMTIGSSNLYSINLLLDKQQSHRLPVKQDGMLSISGLFDQFILSHCSDTNEWFVLTGPQSASEDL